MPIYDAMLSYHFDFYLAQYNNRNFSQFVWNSKWSEELIDNIAIGLEKMGKEKHLQFFYELCSKVESLTEEELDAFLASEYFGENATRDFLNNHAFFDID